MPNDDNVVEIQEREAYRIEYVQLGPNDNIELYSPLRDPVLKLFPTQQGMLQAVGIDPDTLSEDPLYVGFYALYKPGNKTGRNGKPYKNVIALMPISATELHPLAVRRPNSGRTLGRHNIPSIGLFVWPLRSYSVTETPARGLEQVGPHAFTFSALGNDAPLYNRPQQEPEASSLTGELNLPTPIRRRRFEERVVEAGQARVQASAEYYGAGKSLLIWAPNWPAKNAPQPIEVSRIIAADLTDWQYVAPRGAIAVDPKLGRILFPAAQWPKAGVRVTYHYAFSADIGGGEYDRPLSQPAGVVPILVSSRDELAKELAPWQDEVAMSEQPVDAVIEMRLYTVNPSPNAGSIYSVGSGWTETGINWNNAPAISGSPLDSGGAATLNQWVEFDVTAGVALGQPFSFGIKGNVSDAVNYSSRQGLNPPELIITCTNGGGTAPSAAFSASPFNGIAPLAVQFTDLSTGNPTAWTWDFGDNSTSTAPNPSHVYTAPGVYTVQLTASNSFGSDTETKTAYITVESGTAPTAGFSASPVNGIAPLAVQFTDLSTGNPTAWTWDFGDGGTSTQQNPDHTYTAAGTYTVSLTVSNAAGSDTETKTGYITVQAPPEGEDFYISPATAFSVGGVTFEPADIVKYNNEAGTWEMFFDGSDVATTKNLHAFAVLPDGSLLLSWAANQAITGLGTITPMDVVRFTPTSMGSTTAGSFAWYFDGSDVGLTLSSERIDTLALLSDGRVLISPMKSISVTAVGGATITAQDEDVLAFTPTSLGATTTGTWAMYFDGSTVSGLAVENVNSFWQDETTGDIYITIVGPFNLGGVIGDGRDIVRLAPNGRGGYTASLYWDGSAAGLLVDLDGLEIAK